MREQFVSAFVIGLIVVAAVVAGVMYMQRGAHMVLTGAMTVRVISTDENTSLALINLHITNPSDYGFQVNSVTVTLKNAKGDFPAEIVSRVDAQRLFDSLPDDGPFHPTLYYKYNILPRSTGDYTVVAQYSAPEHILQERQQFVVQIEEVGGKVAEFSEK